jgi:beta-glucosidase-like glycosyl hydrolase
MGAALGGSYEENAENAILAGLDFLLVCSKEDMALAVRQKLESLVEEGKIPPRRIAESVERIKRLRDPAPPFPQSFSPERLESLVQELGSLNEEIARASVAHIHGKKRHLLGKKGRYAIFLPNHGWLKNEAAREPGWISRFFHDHLESKDVKEIWYGADDDPSLLFQSLETQKKDLTIILMTFHAHTHDYQRQMASYLKETHPPAVHLSLGIPADIPADVAKVSLACYGCGKTFLEAAFHVIAGKVKAVGGNPFA